MVLGIGVLNEGGGSDGRGWIHAVVVDGPHFHLFRPLEADHDIVGAQGGRSQDEGGLPASPSSGPECLEDLAHGRAPIKGAGDGRGPIIGINVDLDDQQAVGPAHRKRKGNALGVGGRGIGVIESDRAELGPGDGNGKQGYGHQEKPYPGPRPTGPASKDNPINWYGFPHEVPLWHEFQGQGGNPAGFLI